MIEEVTVEANEGIAAPTDTAAVISGAASASTPVDDVRRQDLVMRIPVTVQVVIGKTKMAVADLMNLGPGTIVSLDRSVGNPVDLVVNGHLVARGQLVVVDEATSRFGISLTEVVEQPPIS